MFRPFSYCHVPSNLEAVDHKVPNKWGASTFLRTASYYFYSHLILPCISTVADLDLIIDIIQLLELDEEHFLLRVFSMA